MATKTGRDSGDSLLCSAGTGGYVPEGGEEERCAQNNRVFSEAEQTALNGHNHREMNLSPTHRLWDCRLEHPH